MNKKKFIVLQMKEVKYLENTNLVLAGVGKKKI